MSFFNSFTSWPADTEVISACPLACCRSRLVSNRIRVRKATSADCFAWLFSRITREPVMKADRNMTLKVSGYPGAYAWSV